MEITMAGTVAAQTRDFARRFFQVVLELGCKDWVAASEAFERTLTAHADHPYATYVQANRARKAGFAAAAERVREQEFPQIERRKAGTRRNAPVFYRVGRPGASFSLDLPYEVPSSHPLRAARGAATGSPLRREPEPAARSPWRQRLRRRPTTPGTASAEPRWSAGWWQKLAGGAAGLLDRITRAASKAAAPGGTRKAASRRAR
jgi:hypothetical protein